MDFHPFHFQSPNDLTDDAFYRKVRTVDDVRVLGDDERGRAARGVGAIARGDLVVQTLGLATAETHVGRGVDVEFVGRVGKNDRADVATFHNDVVIADVAAHLFDKDFAESRDAAYE